MHIVKDIFSTWKKKPIHILQDSYQKTCEDIGQSDIVNYEWPGTNAGCYCALTKTATILKCNEKEIQMGCKSIEEIKPYRARKWKTRFLCSSAINSRAYFDLNKVRPSEICPYKYKKCGVIDTLNNHLCIPENEICPLNSISFLNTVDEQNVRIDTSNTNYEGKIFTNFIIAEDKLCVNHLEKSFFENEFILINSKGKFLSGCKTYVGSDYHYEDLNYEKMDTYNKKTFYEHNNIFPFVLKNIPSYPNEIKSSINLYASMFTGWKRECDKKEFNQFRNSNIDTEVNDIVKSTDDYNHFLILYSLALTGVYLLGVLVLKYSRILSGSNKIEISNSSLIIIIISYTSIIIFSVILFYISEVNGDVIKNAKLMNDFFELLSIQDCSDSFTNSLLKNVGKEFFAYPNRYFNIKICSFLTLVVSIVVLLVSIFAKPSDGKNKRNKYQ
jgi:hypothetical protein